METVEKDSNRTFYDELILWNEVYTGFFDSFAVLLENSLFIWRSCIAVKGCKILAFASMGFEQEGIFIVQQLVRHRTSVFAVSSEGPHQFSCLLK